MLVLIEIAIWIATAILVVAWIGNPHANWEPWTVVCGLIGAALEGVRRYRARRPVSSDGRPVPIANSSQPSSLAQDILSRIHQQPLSRLLPDAIELAKQVDNEELERWCRLELYGYGPQGGMRESDVVPEYRGVTGRWMDEHDRMLDLSNYSDLSIVNHYRLRFGMKKLEELAARDKMQNIADDGARQMLRQYTQFDAVRFCFSPVEIVGVLDVVKNLLAEKIRDGIRSHL